MKAAGKRQPLGTAAPAAPVSPAAGPWRRGGFLRQPVSPKWRLCPSSGRRLAAESRLVPCIPGGPVSAGIPRSISTAAEAPWVDLENAAFPNYEIAAWQDTIIPAPLNCFFISIIKIIAISLNTHLVRDAAHLLAVVTADF